MPTQNFIVGEMIHKRTLNSKTWMNFDGSYTTEIFSDIVHYEDENGILQNINTDLYDEADFDIIDEPISMASAEDFKQARTEVKQAKNRSILNRANYNFKGLRLPFNITIPRNFRRGYSIGKGNNKLTFKPIKASPSLSELYEGDRSRIVYQDVWNDTDVELKVNPNGIKETIYLKTEKAPTTFSFEVDGPLEDDLTSGELKLEPAWLMDAEGTKRDVSQTIRRENDETYIDLVADVSELVYPIEIDPTVTLDYRKVKDTFIVQHSPDTIYDSENHYYVGYYGGGLVRALLKFDISTVPLSEIVSANLMLTGNGEYRSSGNDLTTVRIHEAPKAWEPETATWNSFGTSVGTLLDTKIIGTSVQTHSFNVKTAVQEWVNGTKPNNGFVVSTADWLFSLYLSEWEWDVEYRPKISITYNQIPTTPVLKTPNGGENWNSLHTISWTQSTDADDDSLTYEIQLTTNNGSTWKTIKSGVSGGSTTYDFINEPEVSTAKIRIRAYDGISYSAWDESNGVFTIQHFHAPNTPTNLSPKGGIPIDRSNAIRLSWTHSDVNGDQQAKFDLQWRIQGTTTWTTVSATTPNQYFEASPGYFPNGTIEWQVRTYDQTNLTSPYSNIEIFKLGDKPATPTITSHSNGEVIPSPDLTIQWSSFEQIAYHIKVLDTNDNLVWEAQENSTNKALTVGIALANDTNYKIQVAVKNADNLWSDFDTIQIYVSYTPPKQPIVTASQALGHIVLEIINPTPEGTEPEIVGNDVYKRIDGEWVRIAEGVLFEFRDYVVPNEQVCEYFVRANGETGAFVDSDVLTQSITIEGVWLHDITDAGATIYQFKNNTSRSSNWEIESETMNFAGRKRPVIEMGEMDFDSVSFELKLKTKEEIRALQRIVKSRNIVCYRDGNERLLFGVFTKYPVTDELFGQTVDLELMRIDYTEKV